ncbi:hypothetical protein HPB48_017438 [Haemaphysalis longicornis]|uniref:Uncharacterized protein n=1 Tax=Haemaphysalis longicornis TaxID=44386 RepID=A0A9J6GCS3_HAELO|nr:hypothetical protein HPB48_017438 [Haemaphysalis longicornis]
MRVAARLRVQLSLSTHLLLLPLLIIASSRAVFTAASTLGDDASSGELESSTAAAASCPPDDQCDTKKWCWALLASDGKKAGSEDDDGAKCLDELVVDQCGCCRECVRDSPGLPCGGSRRRGVCKAPLECLADVAVGRIAEPLEEGTCHGSRSSSSVSIRTSLSAPFSMPFSFFSLRVPRSSSRSRRKVSPNTALAGRTYPPSSSEDSDRAERVPSHPQTRYKNPPPPAAASRRRRVSREGARNSIRDSGQTTSTPGFVLIQPEDFVFPVDGPGKPRRRCSAKRVRVCRSVQKVLPFRSFCLRFLLLLRLPGSHSASQRGDDVTRDVTRRRETPAKAERAHAARRSFSTGLQREVSSYESAPSLTNKAGACAIIESKKLFRAPLVPTPGALCFPPLLIGAQTDDEKRLVKWSGRRKQRVITGAAAAQRPDSEAE